MAIPDDPFPSVPFSLICEDCDGGMEVESHEDAIRLGWTDIVFAPDLLMANFLGLCPGCRQKQIEEQLQQGRNLPPSCD